MKKRSKLLAAFLCAVMAFTVGCSGKGDAKEEKADAGAQGQQEEQTSESDEYLAIIKKAFSVQRKETVHGQRSESTTKREDGSSEHSVYVETVDLSKERVMSKNSWQDFVYTTYYSRENGNDYSYSGIYSYSEDGTESMTYYKILMDPEDEDEISYSDYEDVDQYKMYESNKDTEYSEVWVTKEGEEELDGVKVLKFRVDYITVLKDIEEETRESVMNTQEWTEEDLALQEGMSDALDAYLEERNAEKKKAMEPQECTDFVYLTSEEHKLVRLDTETKVDNTETPDYDTFWNMADKLNYIKELLGEGMGRDEAVRMAEEAYVGDMGTEGMSPTVSYSVVTYYATGEDCEAVGELPADAKEITWEQWENGDY